MTGRKHAWADDKAGMAAWLVKELGVDAPAGIFGEKSEDGRVQFFGQTHHWWPSTWLSLGSYVSENCATIRTNRVRVLGVNPHATC